MYAVSLCHYLRLAPEGGRDFFLLTITKSTMPAPKATVKSGNCAVLGFQRLDKVFQPLILRFLCGDRATTSSYRALAVSYVQPARCSVVALLLLLRNTGVFRNDILHH